MATTDLLPCLVCHILFPADSKQKIHDNVQELSEYKHSNRIRFWSNINKCGIQLAELLFFRSCKIRFKMNAPALAIFKQLLHNLFVYLYLSSNLISFMTLETTAFRYSHGSVRLCCVFEKLSCSQKCLSPPSNSLLNIKFPQI